MKNASWAGQSDARHLSPADLAKAGVERQEGYVFQRHVPTEVSNELADALLAHPELFGPFDISDIDDSANQLDMSVVDSADKGATESAEATGQGEVLDTPQTGIDTPTVKSTRKAKADQ